LREHSLAAQYVLSGLDKDLFRDVPWYENIALRAEPDEAVLLATLHRIANRYARDDPVNPEVGNLRDADYRARWMTNPNG